MTEAVDDTTIEARADAIRELSHGEGLSVESIRDFEGDLSAFGTYEPEQLYELVKFAASTLPPRDMSTAAISYALGIHVTGPTLSARRMSFMEQVDNLSLRTIQKYEQEGAVTLARQIDVVKLMRVEGGAIWQDGNYKELRELKARVKVLEEHITLIWSTLDIRDNAKLTALLKALKFGTFEEYEQLRSDQWQETMSVLQKDWKSRQGEEKPDDNGANQD